MLDAVSAFQPVVEFDADLIARLSRNGPRYT